MESEGCETNIFQGVKDRYNGLTITSSRESCDLQELSRKLEVSLSYWIKNNVRAVWFRISLEQADWVPVLAKNGFKFHHTKDSDVLMYKWLLVTEECNIPPYAHTMVGVGAVVLNSSGELLVVRERHPGINQWKLPGGYVEPGENIGDAAVREVLEETNIRTVFKYLPLTDKIEKCNREIDACVWMKIDEFLDHPQVHDGNRYFVKKCMEYRNDGKSIGCIQGLHPSMKKPQCVFNIMSNTDIPSYKQQDTL